MRIFVWGVLFVCGCAGTDPADDPRSHDMRFVPGAVFRMGTDSAEFAGIVARTGLMNAGPLGSEFPGHTVRVDPFYIDTVDVTNRGFAEFVRARPEWTRGQVAPSSHNGRYLEPWTDGSPPQDQLAHPVTFVTWASAVAYCHWRGKRLPTEVEYEWAAQGPDGGEYPWGDDPPHDSLVSWGGNGIDHTVRVGSYPPNPRGLYDMSGNIWRFLSDPWLGSYAEAGRAEDPADLETARRVVRGGSWGANAANLRVRYRDSHRPFDAREMVGFRCAMSAGMD